MPEPQPLIGQSQELVERAAPALRHLHVEAARKMQRAELLLPQEVHPVIAPPAGDLDDHLLLAGSVMSPIVGENDFFDQIDRIADRGMNFDRGHRGHRALLEATRQDGINTRIGGNPSGCTPPQGLKRPFLEYSTKLRCQTKAAVARLDLGVLRASTSGTRGTAVFNHT